MPTRTGAFGKPAFLSRARSCSPSRKAVSEVMGPRSALVGIIPRFGTGDRPAFREVTNGMHPKDGGPPGDVLLDLFEGRRAQPRGHHPGPRKGRRIGRVLLVALGDDGVD